MAHLNKNLKLFYLRKILTSYTDREHSISMGEILDALEKYEMKSERKAVYRDIKELEETGIRVKGTRTKNGYLYNVEEREFELAELKLLVDAIQSSRFITEKKSKELIGKLEEFCSEYEAVGLQRQVFVTGRIKTMNESIYKSVDAIYSGIGQNKDISFKYGNWNIRKEMELRHNGEFYKISPWALVWSNEFYYMIGFDPEAGIVKHYRVDKMSVISVTDVSRKGAELFKNFNLADYTRKNISMFEGEEKTVTVEINNNIIGVFIDRFGKDEVTVMSPGEEITRIRFRVNVNPQFLGWIFSLGEKAKIIGPDSVVKQTHEMIKGLQKQYM